MTGGWIEQYPDDVKAIAAAGHELGNHSENHKQMSTLSSEECKKELMTPHEKVKKLTGIDMKVFRPPYGDYNDTLITTVRECGYSPIQWDVDSLDWKDYGVDSIIHTVLDHKHLGNRTTRRKSTSKVYHFRDRRRKNGYPRNGTGGRTYVSTGITEKST